MDFIEVGIDETYDRDSADKFRDTGSRVRTPFMGIKGTEDHDSFIMYRGAAIDKDELEEGIGAMLSDIGYDGDIEDWMSDPKNKSELKVFLDDYAAFSNPNSKKRRFIKESNGKFVEVSAIVKGRGRTIEEAIENFD